MVGRRRAMMLTGGLFGEKQRALRRRARRYSTLLQGLQTRDQSYAEKIESKPAWGNCSVAAKRRRKPEGDGRDYHISR